MSHRRPVLQGGAGAGSRLAFAFALAAPVLALAQPSREIPRAAEAEPSLRMRETEILGEREMPDVFFIVPKGRGGNLSLPHRRDYTDDILRPVVKPWLERDATLAEATASREVGTRSRRTLETRDRERPPAEARERPRAPEPPPRPPVREGPSPWAQ